MLKIGAPYIEYRNQKARLCARLEFPDCEHIAWFEVEKEYAPYLVTDRADAFVTAFLTSAMRAGEDIVSEAPVTKRLLYQLNRQLIPTLSGKMKRYHKMKIVAAPTEEILPCDGAVGVGWTGGVDCFYSFKKYEEMEEPKPKITHLVVLNVGTFETPDTERTLDDFVRRAEHMAGESGIRAMGINSNIHQIVNENYLSVGAFRIPSGILALQKLFAVFLHSSSYEYWRFDWKEENSAFYELFVFDCLETDGTRIYSSLGDQSRIEKITAIADYPPAWTRLHPCIYEKDKNCGICGKCDSVFTTLHTLGKLENFSAVVDTEVVREHLEGFIEDIVLHSGGVYKGELSRLLEKQGMLTPRQKRLAVIMRASQRLEEERERERE